MQDFVNELIVGIALKNPIFWIIIIGAILSTVFYKKDDWNDGRVLDKM